MQEPRCAVQLTLDVYSDTYPTGKRQVQCGQTISVETSSFISLQNALQQITATITGRRIIVVL